MDAFYYSGGVPISLMRSVRFQAFRGSERASVKRTGRSREAASSLAPSEPDELAAEDIGFGLRLRLRDEDTILRARATPPAEEEGEVPVFEAYGGILIPTSEFIVRLKDGVTSRRFEELNKRHGGRNNRAGKP